MSMIEELKMVREAFDWCCPSYFKDGKRAIATLTTIIEQMEKAEPVGWRVANAFFRGNFTAGKPNKETIDYWREQGVELEYAYTHPAPTPEEITKLREQLAICQQTWLSPETYQALMDERSETLKKLAATQAEVERLKEQHHTRYRMWHDEAIKRQALQDNVKALRKELDANLQERVRLQSVINAYERGDLVSKYAAMQPAADEAGKGE